MDTDAIDHFAKGQMESWVKTGKAEYYRDKPDEIESKQVKRERGC